jgi:hypothetical protein
LRFVGDAIGNVRFGEEHMVCSRQTDKFRAGDLSGNITSRVNSYARVAHAMQYERRHADSWENVACVNFAGHPNDGDRGRRACGLTFKTRQRAS